MYKIMIVDDDPTSLAIGKALLENEYELTLARSGLQALGFINGGDIPDMILLDMMMPGFDGMEVLSTLKNDERLSDIPVIFLTGESHIDQQVKSYCNGAADFLQKPVDPDMLHIRINQQIQYMELRRENRLLKEKLDTVKDYLGEKYDEVLSGKK